MTTRCLNCKTPLEARFCPRCGQRDVNLQRPLPDLLGEVLRETFELDGRAARTLATLFRHPGRVTAGYLDGHRQRYTPPFRLFLFFSVAFYLVIAWAAGRGVLTVDGPDSPTVAREHAQFVSDDLPRLVLLLLPVFALILKLLYRRRYYFDHLIHTLHLHCVGFVALGVLIPLERVADEFWQVLVLQVLPFVWLMVYMTLSLHTVYGESWKATVVKAGAVLMLYLMAVSAIMNLFRLLFPPGVATT